MLKGRINLYVLILFIWLGFVYSRISYHFGGVVLIAIGYIILALMVFPGKLYLIKQEKEIRDAIFWFSAFIIVYLLGNELLGVSTKDKVFLGITFSIETFHIIKSFPIWFAFLISLATKKRWHHYCMLTLSLLFIDVVLTLIALEEIPLFSKNLTAGIVSDAMLPYKLTGAMGYELTYSVVLILPLLFFYGYQKKRALLMALSGLFLYYVYRCSFFIALIILLLNISLCFVFSIKSKSLQYTLLFVATISFLALLLSQSFIGRLLLDLSSHIANYELRARFEQLAALFLHGDSSGASLSRFTLYWNDLMWIIKSPILGSAILYPEYVPSGHSAVLGIWGALGIVGIFPFFMLIRCVYLYSIKTVSTVSQKGVILSAFISFLILASVNPIFADPHILSTIIWLVPVISRAFQEDDMVPRVVQVKWKT